MSLARDCWVRIVERRSSCVGEAQAAQQPILRETHLLLAPSLLALLVGELELVQDCAGSGPRAKVLQSGGEGGGQVSGCVTKLALGLAIVSACLACHSRPPPINCSTSLAPTCRVVR